MLVIFYKDWEDEKAAAAEADVYFENSRILCQSEMA
jgi:hypothetical protein